MRYSDQEVIDLLTRDADAFNRGDFDAAIIGCHPDFVMHRAGGLAPVEGANALREWMEPEVFQEASLEPLDLKVNGDKVLAKVRVRAKGAGSGIELEIPQFFVWTFDEDGLAIRLEVFLDHEKAKALGSRRALGPELGGGAAGQEASPGLENLLEPREIPPIGFAHRAGHE